jgi:hypothetical protein
MSQHRFCHGFYVIRCDMKSPLQQRMRSCAENAESAPGRTPVRSHHDGCSEET